MKCPYCGRNVTPTGANCPKCKAKIIRKPEPVETQSEPVENKKEVK